MKKRKENPPKPKEFSASPFSALKGVKTKEPAPAPVKTPPKPLKTENAAAEMDLFLLAMSGVDRLGGKLLKTPASSRPSALKAAVRKIDENEQQVFLDAINGLKLDVRFQDEIPEAGTPAKPHAASRLKQLRRGTIRLDYELDLHGLTRDEAVEALELFIRGACRRGQKAVLVITGKGLHSADEPVLRSAVEKWLRGDGREMISEFFTPPKELGGDGAFAVFLRQAPESQPGPD